MFWILTGIGAVVVLLVQLAYLMFLDLILQRKSVPPTAAAQPPVSVVVCARNEAHHLRHRLRALLEQAYPVYEVLLIDDGSDDATPEVAQALQKQYPQLQYHRLAAADKLFSGKKGALVAGVARAAHDWLLLTDADCVPASPYWIEQMVAALGPETEIVVGYGPYEPRPGTLNAFIRGETLLSFLNIKAFHRVGIHYMAVGRNLCVQKTLFQQVAQNPLWTRTLSGDDDMLMRIGATAHNVAVVSSGEAHVYSPSQPYLNAYIRQKQRHLSTGKYYRWPVKLLLATLSLTHTLSWLLLPCILLGLWVNPAWYVFAAGTLFVVRGLFFAGIFSRQARRYNTPFTFGQLLAFDAGYALYPIFFAPYIFWKNKSQWN
jgi:glycosyltransferase involved in cell wall biosynthesis